MQIYIIVKNKGEYEWYANTVNSKKNREMGVVSDESV